MQRTLLAAAAIACVLTASHWALAQSVPPGSVVMTPDKLTWKPSARTAGVETAALVGDSTKQGAYVERARFPANFKVQPHSHPEERTYTIISGVWYVGWGDKFDEAKLIALPPGSFYTEPANVPHFVAAKGEPVVVQISGVGPTATKMLDAPKQ
jgi:quercetin dioxygenase-like cupin family protein